MHQLFRTSAVVPEPRAASRARAVFAVAEDLCYRIAPLDPQSRVARDGVQDWLERHFVKTAEAAQVLGISPRLLQALAAEGPTTFAGADGRPTKIGLRSVRHGGYWFLRHDVKQTLRARRAGS